MVTLVWKDWLRKLKIFDDFCNQYLTLLISNYWLACFTNDEKCTKQMMGRLHGNMYRIDKHKHTHTLFVFVFVFFNLCIFTAGSQPLYIQDICYPLYTDCLAHLNHGVGQLLRKSVCSISTLTRPTKYKYCHKCKYKLQITSKVGPLR